MERFKRAVREENVDDLWKLIVIAKYHGWGTILDWVEEMSARSTDQDGAAWRSEHNDHNNGSLDINRMWNRTLKAGPNGTLMNSIHGVWGPGRYEVERALAAAEEERTASEEPRQVQKTPDRPESGFGAMVQSLSRFLGIDSNASPSGS